MLVCEGARKVGPVTRGNAELRSCEHIGIEGAQCRDGDDDTEDDSKGRSYNLARKFLYNAVSVYLVRAL